MRFFAPQGRHVAPMGVKFGTLLRAKFHPHRCNDKGVGPPKLKFLLRFDRNVEYKRPARAYPCAIFTKFAEFVHHFRMRLVLKFGWICSRVMELWGFNFRGSGFPQIFSAPSGETMRQTTKPFGGERTCWRSSITMPSLVGLGFHPPPGGQKRWVFACLSVCLFVSRHAFERQKKIVRPISPWRRWSTETILMPLDRGRFVVVHPCSTLSDCCQLATTLNAEVQKIGKIDKIGGFSPPEDDRINRSRRNLARKRRRRVCYSTPNLALIGKRGSVRSSKNCHNLPKIVAFGYRKPTQWTP